MGKGGVLDNKIVKLCEISGVILNRKLIWNQHEQTHKDVGRCVPGQ